MLFTMKSKTSSTSKDDRLRKAAILVDSLDAASADAILDQMNDETAARVRNLVMGLGDVSQQERDEILSEFLHRESAGTRQNVQPESQDVALELSSAAKTASDHPNASYKTYSSYSSSRLPGYDSPLSEIGASGEGPFQFLHQVESRVLADVFEDENAQAIAVVLSHLRPAFCSEVISHLRPDLQAEVMRRLFELGQTDETVLLELETHFRTQVNDVLQLQQRRHAGMATISAILQATDDQRRGRLMSVLERRDFELLSQIETPRFGRPANPVSSQFVDNETVSRHESSQRPQTLPIGQGDRASVTSRVNRAGMDHRPSDRPETVSIHTPLEQDSDKFALAFDDLSLLDESSLLKVFKGLNPKIAILALAGAEPILIDRLLKHVPGREAKSIRKKIERTGPVQLKDIETAQQYIVNIAVKQSRNGTIDLPGCVVNRRAA